MADLSVAQYISGSPMQSGVGSKEFKVNQAKGRLWPYREEREIWYIKRRRGESGGSATFSKICSEDGERMCTYSGPE